MANGAVLKYIFGSMSSGKSLHLLVKAHNFDAKNIPILVIKPYSERIHSRIGVERKCTSITNKDNLFNLAIKHRFCKWILVDECQFLTQLQVEQLARVVDTIGINVVCYGLRTDFKSRLFAGSKRLFELADSIEEIKSYCDCGNRAIINARFDANGKMVTEGEQLLLGGDETYRAICRECFFNNITKEEMVTDNETN